MFVYPYKDGARTGLMVKPVGGFDSSRKRFLSGSFEAQLKKAKEYVTSLALDADKLEDKEKAKFEDGRAIHNSVKNGLGAHIVVDAPPSALAERAARTCCNDKHRVPVPAKRRRPTLKVASNAKGQQRRRF